jgi:glycosyltransferase involved in cell wall biosynthesis
VNAAPQPLVSVVLRTYGHAPFIAQAIESVLIQRTEFPCELVIGEDCSTDGTREIVEAYGRTYPEIVKPVLPERNVGHGEMLRQALAATRGELIAYLDGDDYWSSRHKLARQVEFLQANPDCHDCFHDVSLVYDEAGAPSGTITPRLAEEHFGIEQILMECFVPAPAMMFRRSVFEELDREAFDSAWLDWIIHVQAATRGPLGYLPEAMACYRVHRGGMFSSLDRVTQLEEDANFYARFLSQLPEQRPLIERCLAHRKAQLAIERLGVPFDACVVLADPRREFRPYFNGRHARALPRREGREVTELQAIREAAASLPPAVEDYGSGIAGPAEGDRGCFLVVPRTAAEWFDRHLDLIDYLGRNARLAWDDDWVRIHRLEPLPSDGDGQRERDLRRVRVKPLCGTSELPAAFFDTPTDGALLPAHAVMVTGWMAASGGPARAIEFHCGGELIWRAPVTRVRPDVAKLFPEADAAAPGFQTTVNVCDLPPGARVEVVGLFDDGSRVQIGELDLEGPGDAPEAEG